MCFPFLFQGFTLEFYFDTNDFFTNTVLTKHYSMRSEPDEEDPFSFEGPEIVKCKGYDNSLFHALKFFSSVIFKIIFVYFLCNVFFSVVR